MKKRKRKRENVTENKKEKKAKQQQTKEKCKTLERIRRYNREGARISVQETDYESNKAGRNKKNLEVHKGLAARANVGFPRCVDNKELGKTSISGERRSGEFM